jgi:hypothetical protein
MRRARPGWVGVLAGLVLLGCETSRERMVRRLGPAAQIASASIDNLGWSRDGKRIDSARFTAIVTTYDEEGRSYTDRQEMVVDFKADTITAVGGTPQGRWKAVADDDGKFKLKADKAVDEAKVAGRMRPTLATLLHRLRGPYNLLAGRERARTADATRVDGQDVVRVAVGGDNRRAIAYYFDAASGILRFVTAGADRPGGEGTVTLYQYDSLPNGVAFPNRIRVARIGKHVLVGKESVFEVEISHVSF